DFNVPLTEGKISDDSRIVAALESIRYVLGKGGRLVLMSHLGRPKGREEKYSLAPCAKRLGELLGREVKMAPDCVGKEVEKIVEGLGEGEVVLLENLRFHEEEEEPEKEFVKGLAKLGEVYVDDAFGTAHRAHASTVYVAQLFPGRAVMGFLMEKEVEVLSKLLQGAKRPFYAIIGGSKVSTKVGVMKSLLSLIDGVFIGGAMAYTFLEIGKCDEKEVAKAREVLEEAKRKKIPCWLPEDLIIADAFSNTANSRVIDVKEGIPTGWQGMGIGPKTVKTWSGILQESATIFWNGPLSVFEMSKFAKPTFEIACFLADLPKATIVVGGGDSVAAIKQMGLEKKFTHLSTGGGASLEFLEFGHLPGIDVLSERK
ncbi:MAG: phosphoglycerate kinase, partial [Chlamydiales bacterium]|nr:phosphoglycerate kinase [Chlamydiales bacterium]